MAIAAKAAAAIDAVNVIFPIIIMNRARGFLCLVVCCVIKQTLSTKCCKQNIPENGEAHFDWQIKQSTKQQLYFDFNSQKKANIPVAKMTRNLSAGASLTLRRLYAGTQTKPKPSPSLKFPAIGNLQPVQALSFNAWSAGTDSPDQMSCEVQCADGALQNSSSGGSPSGSSATRHRYRLPVEMYGSPNDG